MSIVKAGSKRDFWTILGIMLSEENFRTVVTIYHTSVLFTLFIMIISSLFSYNYARAAVYVVLLLSLEIDWIALIMVSALMCWLGYTQKSLIISVIARAIVLISLIFVLIYLPYNYVIIDVWRFFSNRALAFVLTFIALNLNISSLAALTSPEKAQKFYSDAQAYMRAVGLSYTLLQVFYALFLMQAILNGLIPPIVQPWAIFITLMILFIAQIILTMKKIKLRKAGIDYYYSLLTTSISDLLRKISSDVEEIRKRLENVEKRLSGSME
ncbi:MAG: hypothetical protein GXO26_04545 [Crenarchaeota archaeon]|nr:hypothetical protein [Thermoproteota archaeon]